MKKTVVYATIGALIFSEPHGLRPGKTVGDLQAALAAGSVNIANLNEYVDADRLINAAGSALNNPLLSEVRVQSVITELGGSAISRNEAKTLGTLLTGYRKAQKAAERETTVGKLDEHRKSPYGDMPATGPGDRPPPASATPPRMDPSRLDLFRGRENPRAEPRVAAANTEAGERTVAQDPRTTFLELTKTSLPHEGAEEMRFDEGTTLTWGENYIHRFAAAVRSRQCDINSDIGYEYAGVIVQNNLLTVTLAAALNLGIAYDGTTGVLRLVTRPLNQAELTSVGKLKTALDGSGYDLTDALTKLETGQADAHIIDEIYGAVSAYCICYGLDKIEQLNIPDEGLIRPTALTMICRILGRTDAIFGGEVGSAFGPCIGKETLRRMAKQAGLSGALEPEDWLGKAESLEIIKASCVGDTATGTADEALFIIQKLGDGTPLPPDLACIGIGTWGTHGFGHTTTPDALKSTCDYWISRGGNMEAERARLADLIRLESEADRGEAHWTRALIRNLELIDGYLAERKT
ncbi:MAG: hypothetical protein LBS14_04070 [Holosporaceae bacterium]|jgi:hypothetical protein|nr:hypothetical protein [Holosporaceae bacterium]